MKRWKISAIMSFAWMAAFCGVLRAGDEPVKLARHGNEIQIIIGGKPFTTYYFPSEVSKPYFQPLRSAQGTIVTRGFPILNTVPAGHEHDPSLEPHQRPMYFGHGDINGNDFWGEEAFVKYYGKEVSPKYGRQVFRKIDEMQSGADSGTLRATFDLVGSDGKPFAEETQSFTFRGDETSRTVDCEFTIRANHGPVKMGDTKEGTFAIRVVPELNEPAVRMLNSNGKVGEKEIWGQRADWVDYSGNVSGESLGIAIFDNPQNLRHPSTWHARGYGLFSVNPFGESYFYRDPKRDGSYTIESGQSLTLRYRVIIHHGNAAEAHVTEAYKSYASGK
jgi:methane monooxygenase PmoA-like